MDNDKPATKRVKRDERRRLVRTAKYALVRGAASAHTGSAAVGLLVWWLTNHH